MNTPTNASVSMGTHLGHLFLHKSGLQIDQVARRLVRQEHRHDVDGGLDTCLAAAARHGVRHRCHEPLVLPLAKGVEKVFLGRK